MPRPGPLGRWLTSGRLALAGASLLAAMVPAMPVAGQAVGCLPVAQAPGLGPGLMRARFTMPLSGPGRPAARRVQAIPGPPPRAGAVGLTYLGHSSYLIRTAKGVTAITDYNGYTRAALPPDIVTMNHAHETHYTDFVEPGVKHILRGWTTADGGYPRHDVTLSDLRVRNVATNIRGLDGGMEFAGNSIFIFESGGLCIAHLGHRHHLLTPSHLGRIGAVDILLVPIDDGLTMPQADFAEVIRALDPRVVMPMHYSDQGLVDQFLDLMRKLGYRARVHRAPTIRFTKRTLPRRTVVVLQGGGF